MAKSETDPKQEAFQSTYMELQMLEQHTKRVQQQLDMLQKQADELLNTKNHLTEIGAIANGKDILIPLAGGIFAKGTITNTYSLLVNVGADVVLEKPVADVQRIIDEQITDIRAIETELNTQLEHVSTQSEKLTEDLRALAN